MAIRRKCFAGRLVCDLENPERRLGSGHITFYVARSYQVRYRALRTPISAAMASNMSWKESKTMKFRHHWLMVFATFSLSAHLPGADVEIGGFTHEWQRGKYTPLPKVKVVVSRNGSYVKATQSETNPM